MAAWDSRHQAARPESEPGCSIRAEVRRLRRQQAEMCEQLRNMMGIIASIVCKDTDSPSASSARLPADVDNDATLDKGDADDKPDKDTGNSSRTDPKPENPDIRDPFDNSTGDGEKGKPHNAGHNDEADTEECNTEKGRAEYGVRAQECVTTPIRNARLPNTPATPCKGRARAATSTPSAKPDQMVNPEVEPPGTCRKFLTLCEAWNDPSIPLSIRRPWDVYSDNTRAETVDEDCEVRASISELRAFSSLPLHEQEVFAKVSRMELAAFAAWRGQERDAGRSVGKAVAAWDDLDDQVKGSWVPTNSDRALEDEGCWAPASWLKVSTRAVETSRPIVGADNKKLSKLFAECISGTLSHWRQRGRQALPVSELGRFVGMFSQITLNPKVAGFDDISSLLGAWPEQFELTASTSLSGKLLQEVRLRG